MPGIIQTGHFSKDLIPLVNKWFGDYPEWEPLYSKIFEINTSDRNYEEDALFSGMGTAVLKPQGSGVRFDGAKQVYTPRYVHEVYGLGFIITEEMMDDGIAFKNAKRFTEMLKRACLQAREIVCHDVINRATTSGYTMENGDGVVLASASHPSTAGTYSNMPAVAADLSEAMLEQAVFDIRNIRDDRGLRIMLRPDRIVMNQQNEAELRRILNNTDRPATTDRDINAIRNAGWFPGGFVVTPYMTDTDAVAIITNCPDGLKYMDRKALAIKNDNDFDTDNAKFKAQLRFSVGWSDPRGFYYSEGAA